MVTPLDTLLRTVGLSAREVFARGGPPPMSLWRWKQGVEARPATIRRLAVTVGQPFDVVALAVLQTVADARKRAAPRDERAMA